MEDFYITKSWDFNPTLENINFKHPGFSQSGFGSVSIDYNNGSINIQTHELASPFGFSKGVSRYGSDPHVALNLNPNEDNDRIFLKSLEELEKIIIRNAYEHRVEWGLFNSRMEADSASMEDIRNKFSRMIRPSKGNYPPTLRISFLTNKDKSSITTPCHDVNNVTIIPSEKTIPRRSRCICDIQGKMIWISPDGKFGLKWKMTKLKVIPSVDNQMSYHVQDNSHDVNLPAGKCLLDDEDDE